MSKFCSHCGSEVNEDAVVCIKCGRSLNNNEEVLSTEDANTVSVGLVVLSVFFPLFGWIYWAVMSKKRPKCAKYCGIAGIISWGVSMVLGLIFGSLLSSIIATTIPMLY